MENCIRAGRLFGGCKFKPRYDYPPVSEAVLSSFIGRDEIEAAQGEIYLYDVCERCGRIIKRAE